MFSSLLELFNLILYVLDHGGWIFLVASLAFMFYKLYMDYIQIRWYNTLNWVFLKITAPPNNETSPLAFEQIFNQLHAIHGHLSWAEIHLEGRFDIWFTWEITSIGGVIGNYVKIQDRYRHTLEAAIYSQFPSAEIMETEDYFQQLPKYHVDRSEYDIFAFSYQFLKPNYYPVRTFLDFEHASADTFIDPVTGIWEELGKISPYEMFVVQFVLRPIPDDWTEKGYQSVKKLKGEREALESPRDRFVEFVSAILGPFLDVIIRRQTVEDEKKKNSKDELPFSMMLHLSEGEKQVIAGIERKLSKWAYKTKIHCMYIAPRAKYNYAPPISAVIGAFKSLSATQLNSLKPLLRRWTKIDYLAFKELEKPMIDMRVKFRKTRYMNFMRRRWWFWGPPAVILNTEELATMIHFPQMNVTVPQIDTVSVTKVQPPPELPIIE